MKKIKKLSEENNFVKEELKEMKLSFEQIEKELENIFESIRLTEVAGVLKPKEIQQLKDIKALVKSLIKGLP
jgi:predicted RNase H-like nuclease (RuvC/YqgF family)